ncbi:Uncharacterised protein [Pantoea agglomerans]|uniref:Uncharacterized protein n=1 Tax=Enterobacter agglomerans TaxID=549 RepID=A0A379AAJ5_ENTAG|nr:Uncharacterised protein [Pantoea agglomerans]
MRIRDYIRDVLLMCQKRDNKSGLPRAAQGGACGSRHASHGKRPQILPRRASQHYVHEIKACIFRAAIRAFLPHLILAAIDFRYTKPHVT